MIVGSRHLLDGVHGLVHHCRRTASSRSIGPVDTPIQIYIKIKHKNLSVHKRFSVSISPITKDFVLSI